MNTRRFVSVVFALALLIVVVVKLTHHEFRPKSSIMEFDDLTHAGHYFIGDHRSDASIECRVTALRDLEATWGHEVSRCSFGEGWLPPSRSGAEVYGKVARVEIELTGGEARVLVMRIRAHATLPKGVNQSVRIFANGQEIGDHPVARNWHKIRQPIPPGSLHGGRNEVTFEFSNAVSPRQAGGSKDSRAMAAIVGELFLLRSPVDNSDPTTTQVWDDNRQAFVIQHSGTLIMPVLVPQDATNLTFDLQPSRSVDLSSIEVELAIEDLDGQRQHRATLTGRSVRDRGALGLTVEDLNGSWALLKAKVTLDGGNLVLSPPQIDITPAENPRPSALPSPLTAPADLPDIVLITLDAARSDRFSFSGHNRLNSPAIDALAAESTVFPHAYALAPYTLCSVPTMITGLSFLDHGVVEHENVLSDDATTLAESLKGAGYRTAGFSATPNNSKSKGFAQGYDVFREIWTEGEKSETRRAHFIAQRAVEWLESNDDDARPLHLQVHMVPPHGPYDPPEAFDIFTDPSYDGPCDGYHRTISTVDGRERPATEECIEHLFNLYDGNLRTADDATGMIIKALKSRSRWKDTVVLVTSDHGEAFWDHGTLGHNSTLYNEMLHVPFVLRLPPIQRGRPIETERLVTLADIVPTLLGTAGITTVEGGAGVDLLAPNPTTTGRFMVARTTSNRPYFGLRTLRWSLAVNAAGAGTLFDRSTDPFERDNLSFGRAATFAGLGRILTRRIGLPPQLVISTDSADITEDERDLLEALGYVRD